MTLQRQLITSIIVIFLVAFAGTLAISIYNARSSLIQQQETYSQNVATALGITLSNAVKQDDKATQLALIQASFDRGYYQKIQLTNIQGKVLIKRQSKLKVQGVPHWFIKLIPINLKPGKANIMSGWQQLGTITVTGHPGYVYHELWRDSLNLMWWFIAFMIALIILAIIWLRILLKPLAAIKRQAEAVIKREFIVHEPLPKTYDLRRLNQAMNEMVTKLKATFAAQSKLAGRLRKKAFQDPVTEVANRRFFNNQLHYLAKTDSEYQQGTLIILELQGFKEFNNQYGFEQGDKLLIGLVDVAEGILTNTKWHLLARLGGTNFTILTLHNTVNETQKLLAQLSKTINKYLANSIKDNKAPSAFLGATNFEPGFNASNLLASVDNALHTARTQQSPNWYYLTKEAKPLTTSSATTWHNILKDVIKNKRISLYFQPTFNDDQSAILHYEVLLRIYNHDGELIPAVSFIAYAEQFNLACQLDKLVIERLISKLNLRQIIRQKYVINISTNTLQDTTFIPWLNDLLMKHQDLPTNLMFEFTERTALQHLKQFKSFVAKLNHMNIHVGLDNFGISFSDFGYIASLKLDYIKFAGSFTRNLLENRDHEFYLASLTSIVHTVGIQAIATQIETADQLSILQTLGIDGYQGKFIAEPSAMPHTMD